MASRPEPQRRSTLVVNCSIVLKDLPLEERLAQVRAAGYDAIELWWPFASATPEDDELTSVTRTIENSGLRLTALNLFAGDLIAGERGILSSPARVDELRASADIARALALRLGVRLFNVLYGNRLDAVDAREADEVAEKNLRELAPRFAKFGGVLMIEPVSGIPAYPVKTAADAASVIARAQAGDGPKNLGILFDLYHLASNGDDVDAAIEDYGSLAAHVQLADAPGRGAPGTGELPLAAWVTRLRSLGYAGDVALEYIHPTNQALALADSWRNLV